MRIESYEDLADTSCIWICAACESSTFSESILHSGVDLNIRKSFSPLQELESLSVDISVPPLQSTPRQQYSCSAKKPEKRKSTRRNMLLKLMILNCCSLVSTAKQAEFHALVDEVNPDIICGTESHLDGSISSSEVFPNGYEIFQKDRNQYGGGVFTAVSNKYIASSMLELDENCELLWISLQCQGVIPLYICTFYRPPKSNLEVLEALGKSLEKLNQHRTLPNILLAGDFNLPDILWENSSLRSNLVYSSGLSYHMIDIANDNYLTQMVNEPTRGSNILDFIFTTTPDLVNSVQACPGMSDHYAVTAELNMRAKPNPKRMRTVYLYKRANWDKIKSDLNQFQQSFMVSSPYVNTVNDNWEALKSAIKDTVKTNIRSKTLKGKNNLPWINRELKRAIRKRKRL